MNDELTAGTSFIVHHSSFIVLKMFKYILENAGDIQWLALMPLVLFFLIFVGALIMTMLKNKSYIERMSQMPFEENSAETQI